MKNYIKYILVIAVLCLGAYIVYPPVAETFAVNYNEHEFDKLADAVKHDDTDALSHAVEDGINVASIKDSRQHTLLMVATYNSNLRSVYWLLRHNANINVQDCNGNTALTYAAHSIGTPVGLQIFKILVQHGADVDIKDDKGFSPKDYLTPKNE